MSVNFHLRVETVVKDLSFDINCPQDSGQLAEHVQDNTLTKEAYEAFFGKCVDTEKTPIAFKSTKR